MVGMACAMALTATMAQADVISNWNERAIATLSAAKVVDAVGVARTLAMVHEAMYGGIQQSQRSTIPQEIAADAAARRVLATLYPQQTPDIDSAFNIEIEKFKANPQKEAGIAAGEKAASAVLAERANDGFRAPEDYRPNATPGLYITTALPVFSNVGGMKPFVLKSISQFRPGPPPALSSEVYARDYNETKDYGFARSEKRNLWQTETARFWDRDGLIAWNQAARDMLQSKQLPLSESARMFMLLNVASHDAYVAVFDAKYAYQFWRPVTAIRNGDRTNNSATPRDASWTPLINTPMHPEYPCAHCVIDGAAGMVMKSFYGSGTVPAFTLTNSAMPGVTREYTSFQQLEDEVSMARIWAGVHYRNSTEVGHELGKKVGEYVLTNRSL